MRAANWDNKMGISPRPADRRPPTLAEVSPEYGAAVEKRAALSAEIDQLSNERHQVARKIDAEGGFSDSAAAAIAKRNVKEARVAEILGEKPGPDENELQRYIEIGQRIGDLKAAREILDRRLLDLRMSASNLVCELIEADHKKMVADICERMVELHAAADAYCGFADSLNADGVAWSKLWAMQPQFIGAPNDRQGRLSLYLREAVKFGFWHPEQIPEKLK